jgi:hypothetical protein
MANGYLNTQKSTTNAAGKVAPEGYHYMPDGRLMSDAEHYVRFGADFTINTFEMDYSDIRQSGEIRNFSINGSLGAKFNLFITNEDNSYYNFQTKKFQTAKYTLSNTIGTSTYTNSINFPNVSDADQYDIFLFAELGTKHADYREVRTEDGALDINASTGSNSLLLQKVIYQKLDTTITVQPASPTSSNDFDSMSTTTQAITSSFGKSTPKLSFSVTSNSASTKAFQINNQPTQKDVYATATRVIGSVSNIEGENIYPAVSNTDTVDGSISSTNKIVMDSNVATKMVVGDKVTVTSAVSTDTVDGDLEGSISKIVMDNNVASKMRLGDRVRFQEPGATGAKHFEVQTILVAALDPDGDNPKEFQLGDVTGAPVTLSGAQVPDGTTLTFESFLNRDTYTVGALNPDGDNVKEFSLSVVPVVSGVLDGVTLSFSNRKNYSFSIDNVEGLLEDMVVTGTNVEAGTVIGSYQESITTEESSGVSYETVIKEKSGIKSRKKPTITRNATTKLVTTTRGGDITFNNQQPLALEGDTINIYAYGREQIRSLTGWDLEVTNLKAELATVTTTTTSAVSDNATVPVASGDGIVEGISTVSGIGIDPAAVDPTVSTINSYSGTTASLILSAAQTLEDGITLTFNGGGELVTITGDVQVYKTGPAALTLNIDLEKFMTATNEAS